MHAAAGMYLRSVVVHDNSCMYKPQAWLFTQLVYACMDLTVYIMQYAVVTKTQQLMKTILQAL